MCVCVCVCVCVCACVCIFACIAVRLLREELVLLQEPASNVGEVVKTMGQDKVLVKVGAFACVHPARAQARVGVLAHGRVFDCLFMCVFMCVCQHVAWV